MVGIDGFGPIRLREQLFRILDRLPPIEAEHVRPAKLPVAEVMKLGPMVLDGHRRRVPRDGLLDVSLAKVGEYILMNFLKDI